MFKDPSLGIQSYLRFGGTGVVGFGGSSRAVPEKVRLDPYKPIGLYQVPTSLHMQ